MLGIKKPIKKKKENKEFKKELAGSVYQLELLFFFLWKSYIKKYNFQLGTEKSEGVKFDDVVFYFEKNGKIFGRYVQAKHAMYSKAKFAYDDFVTDHEKAKGNLKKYFISFRIIQQTAVSKQLEDLIICTNIGFQDTTLKNPKNGNILKFEEQKNDSDEFFKSNDDFNRYKLNIESVKKNSELKDYLKNSSNLSLLAEKLVNCIVKNKPLNLKNYWVSLYKKALLNENVIQRQQFVKIEYNKIELQKSEIKEIKKKSKFSEDLQTFNENFRQEFTLLTKSNNFESLESIKIDHDFVSFSDGISETPSPQDNSQKLYAIPHVAKILAEHSLNDKNEKMNSAYLQNFHIHKILKHILKVSEGYGFSKDFIDGYKETFDKIIKNVREKFFCAKPEQQEKLKTMFEVEFQKLQETTNVPSEITFSTLFYDDVMLENKYDEQHLLTMLDIVLKKSNSIIDLKEIQSDINVILFRVILFKRFKAKLTSFLQDKELYIADELLQICFSTKNEETIKNENDPNLKMTGKLEDHITTLAKNLSHCFFYQKVLTSTVITKNDESFLKDVLQLKGNEKVKLKGTFITNNKKLSNDISKFRDLFLQFFVLEALKNKEIQFKENDDSINTIAEEILHMIKTVRLGQKTVKYNREILEKHDLKKTFERMLEDLFVFFNNKFVSFNNDFFIKKGLPEDVEKIREKLKLILLNEKIGEIKKYEFNATTVISSAKIEMSVNMDPLKTAKNFYELIMSNEERTEVLTNENENSTALLLKLLEAKKVLVYNDDKSKLEFKDSFFTGNLPNDVKEFRTELKKNLLETIWNAIVQGKFQFTPVPFFCNKEGITELANEITKIELNNDVKILYNRKIYGKDKTKYLIESLAGSVFISFGKKNKIKMKEKFFKDDVKLTIAAMIFKEHLKTTYGTKFFQLKNLEIEITEYPFYCEKLIENGSVMDDIEEFCDKLIIVTNPKDNFKQLVAAELSRHIHWTGADLSAKALFTDVLDWVKENENRMLNKYDAIALINKLKNHRESSLFNGLNICYSAELQKYEITFENYHTEFQQCLANEESGQIIWLKTNSTFFSAIKVKALLQNEVKQKYVFNTTTVLTNFTDELKPHFKKDATLLIINDDGDKNDNIKICKLWNAIKSSEMRMVVIADENSALIKRFNGTIEVINDKETSFSYLSPTSQKKLMMKKIKFQDKTMAFKDLLIDNGSYNLIDSQTTYLLTTEPEKINLAKSKHLQNNKKHYITRRINNSGNTEVEFLKSIKKEKVFLVAETAGMGKTTLLAKMAQTVNLVYDSPRWILEISLKENNSWLENLKSQKEKLSINFENFNGNEEDYGKIILRALHVDEDPNEENWDFEKRLFKYFFENGRMIIIFDGFDEISTDSAKMVIQLMKEIKKTKNHMWISTRLKQKHLLETNLKTVAYRLAPFTKKNQIRFLCNRWKKCSDKWNPHLKEYAEHLIEKFILAVGEKHKDFISNPLHLDMLANIFQPKDDDDKFLQGDFDQIQINTCDKNIEFNKKIADVFNLYHDIIYKKILEHFKDKCLLNQENVAANRNYKTLIEKEETMHAIWGIIHHKDIENLSNECFSALPTEQEHKKKKIWINDFECGAVNIGIIDDINNREIPVFAHLAFAEYFAASYVFKIMQNVSVICENYITKRLEAFFGIIDSFLNSKSSIIVNALEAIEANMYMDQLFILVVKFKAHSMTKSMITKLKFDINAHDHHGCNSLFYAVKNNDICMTELLLKNGADFDACMHGELSLFKELSEHIEKLFSFIDKQDFENFKKHLDMSNSLDIIMNAKIRRQESIFEYVQNKNIYEWVDYLLQKGATINENNEISQTNKRTMNLFDSVKNIINNICKKETNSTAVIKEMAKHSHFITKVKYVKSGESKLIGNTLLHYSVVNDREKIVKWLINNGAVQESKYSDICDIFDLASKHGSHNVLSNLHHAKK